MPGIYEGLYCEHEATHFCDGKDGSISASAFCTNGGTCLGDSKSGFICDCPQGYIGDHCQFISGSMPDEWDKTPAFSVYKTGTANSGGKPGGGAVAGIAIGLLVVVIALGVYIYNKKDEIAEDIKHVMGAVKKQKDVEVVDNEGNAGAAEGGDKDEEAPVSSDKSIKSNASGADLELEADGSILQEVMSEAGSPTKTPQKKKSESGDVMDNEEHIDAANMPVSPSAEDSEII